MNLRAIIVDNNRDRAAMIEAGMASTYIVVARLNSVDALSLENEEIMPNIVIIGVDATDESMLVKVQYASAKFVCPVVMFVESSNARITRAAVQAGVTAYIVGGLTKHRVNDVLDVALERFREYRAVFEELKSTKNQLVDRKKIERAKGLLMSRDNLSEENAYHALRHLAMERNQRIVDIANKILENL